MVRKVCPRGKANRKDGPQSRGVVPPLAATAAILGFLGVALGAFAAHALKLTARPHELWETATQYHLIHALAALYAAGRGSLRAGWLFVAGVVLFSGSLYLLALTGLRALGPITPLGGVCFLVGWVMLAYETLRRDTKA